MHLKQMACKHHRLRNHLLTGHQAACSLTSHEPQEALGEALLQCLGLSDLNHLRIGLRLLYAATKDGLQGTAEDSLCASGRP